jgi:hypothetical protein
VPADDVIKCAKPLPKSAASFVKGFPVVIPFVWVATSAIAMTTSLAIVVVTAALDGVAVEAWLFRTAVTSSGAKRSAPANSQITTPALVTLALALIVIAVAPDTLFLAYQMSIEQQLGPGE